MSLLQVGELAPDFMLSTGPGRFVRLSSFRGRSVVLVFYQADWSPICGTQLDRLNANLDKFQELGAEVIGVSVDSPWSHQAFAASRRLRFLLVSDFEPKGLVARHYGVYRDREGASERALYVVDAAGRVAWSHLSPVGADPGVDGVLDVLAVTGGASRGGTTRQLTVAVGESDHWKGTPNASVTLVEYGDYECPHCAAARDVISALMAKFSGDVRFVFRNFPLVRLHPNAEFAAIAAEAAGGLGAFWPMHDQLFAHQGELHSDDILRYAETIFPDHDAFLAEIENPIWRGRVLGDIRSGLDSGVNGTPTFFLNGNRYDGAHTLDDMATAIRFLLDSMP